MVASPDQRYISSDSNGHDIGDPFDENNLDASQYFIDYGFQNNIINFHTARNPYYSDLNAFDSVTIINIKIMDIEFYPVKEQQPLIANFNVEIGTVTIGHINMQNVECYL